MNDGKPSVSLRTANAMGRQVPGYNIGTLLSEGRSTKKLEGKDEDAKEFLEAYGQKPAHLEFCHQHCQSFWMCYFALSLLDY